MVTTTLINGDCLHKLKELAENSVDSIVTDPPAGISFMNKEWDDDKGGRDSWIKWMEEIAVECLRVLKPGGHALVWAIPRTSHWTGMAWENAGFEVRDKICHIFGTGFPKSMSIEKAIDNHLGAERKIIGTTKGKGGENLNTLSREGKGDTENAKGVGAYGLGAKQTTIDIPVTEAATDEAKQWIGWGTNLKPAMEDWWLLRKPISEKTIAANVLKHGTGGINIDATRIPITPDIDDPRLGGNGSWKTDNSYTGKNGIYSDFAGEEVSSSPLGRFPSNLIHDGSEEVVSLFPESKGQQGNVKGTEPSHTGQNGVYGEYGRVESQKRGDGGSAARFFYCAKASGSDRNEGLDDFEEKSIGSKGNGIRRICSQCGESSLESHLCKCETKDWINPPTKKNHHPTVKNTELMKYLIKLVTPIGGTVLDPFMGSGSTGKAAVLENFNFVGIELQKEYYDIAHARIEYAKKPQPVKTTKSKKDKPKTTSTLSSTLFE